MAACPVCRSAPLRPFLDAGTAPAFCNALWPTREAALAAPRGPIRLAFCDTCGLIRNEAFDPALVRYGPGYENSLHFSPVFGAFARELAERLIERYALHGARIVDVGCGRGDFLRLLCEAGGNRGVGYDPSYEGPDSEGPVAFVRAPYSPLDARAPAELLCCRHVLEHLGDPHPLIATVAGGAARFAYLEVPDGGHLLRGHAVWDVIYEHPSHFTAPALVRLLETHGLHPLEAGSAFGGQYLWAEAGRGAPATPVATEAPEALAAHLEPFAAAFAGKVAEWGRRLAEIHAAGRRVALWGAGSKGTTFLNAVEAGATVEHVIDLNPRKHGRHVPGTGQAVRGPEALEAAPPDVVLVMNPLYEREIRERLAGAGLAPEVLVV